MHQNFTKLNPSFFRSGLVLMFTLLFAFSNTMGQTYTNGNLATGDTAANGTVAPAGYTYSQLQTGANSIGFSASVAANLSIADDFTVPAGQAWTISTMVFYGYSTGYSGTTSPFNTIRIKIYNSDPSVGSPTPIFGDLTTNRFASSANANIYRIGATPDVNRKIWSITANTPIQLGPGTYWVEFQIGTIAGVTSNFMPPSTIRGALTLPGYNALQHDIAGSQWAPLVDGTARMDMPFKVNYTSCTAPTISISSTGSCIPATLTASGADTYSWSPANGLNTTTGATVTASPVGTTTYTVTGTANGCVGTASITLANPFTSATLSGQSPEETIINESFNDSLPAGWESINNSDVVGALENWTQGNATVFPSHSGADDAYILANYQMTDGSTISAWMLTPQVSIKNGDKISFWTRTTDGTYPDRLELRMSTSGASSNVGTTPTSVGDFTTLLLSVNPDLLDGDAYPLDWTKFEATISGLAAPVTGKFGFRYFVTNAGPDGDNSDLIGIDDVVFSSPLSCTPAGSTQNITVNITGGAAPYTVVYSDGTSNITVPNYTNGALIPVTPNGTTTYTLVSVASAGGCTGANITGAYTFTGGASITSQPDSLTSICGSGPATISVVAGGTGNTYQWQVSTDNGQTFTNVTDGTNYSGSNTASLVISNITPAMTGYVYHVNVTGSDCPGAVTSLNSTLSVAADPVITNQPVSSSTCEGETATFTVGSNGTTFLWQVSTDGGLTFTDMPNDVTSTLILNAISAFNNNIYRVVVGNGCGVNVNSTGATLLVAPVATITTQPNAVTSVCGATNATISVAVSGSTTDYQWQVSTDNGATFTEIANGPNYSGVNTNTLTIIAPAESMNGYMYNVVVFSNCGMVTSDTSVLNVSAQTTITGQPANSSVCEGQTATYTVVSNGTTFQWQVSTDGGATYTDVVGANSATYVTDATTLAMTGSSYRVLVGGCSTPVTSSAATLTVSAGSTITTQPNATTSVCGGTNATISVAVSGTPTSYQWQVSTDNGATFADVTDGANYGGATTNTLTILTPAESTTGYIYHLNIISACGTITSGSSVLNVSAQTAITGQPANSSVCEGETATYTVVSNGTTFQWQLSTDGGATYTDIAGANSATYVTDPATLAMHGSFYRVIVGGCATSVTSTAGGLKVRTPANITSQPASATFCDGQNATFSVTAVADSLAYQWQVSTDGGLTFTDIAQATSSTLTVPAQATSNNNQYQVLINNGCGNIVTSSAATLTVTPATVIGTQPQAVQICAGSDATFTADATGTNVTYQWSLISSTGTTTITGATNPSYTVTAATAGMNGNIYFVTVTSTCGDQVSDSALLTVNSPGSIEIESQVACEGSDVTFTATGSGSGTGTTFQWQVSTDGGLTFTDISGETNSTLVLTGITLDMNNSIYRVVGTGACGSSNSTNGTLTVNPNPIVGIDGPTEAVCEGSSITLTGTGATTYTFDNGVTNGVAFIINSTNTYTVIGEENGCMGTAAITVSVNPTPVVTITSTATDLNEGQSATITATSTPAATVYAWYKDGSLLVDSTGSSIVVDYANPGVYTAIASTGDCSDTSNAITITAIPVNRFFSFITPNPNNGRFKVNYANTGTLTPSRVITIFDSKGSLIYMKTFSVNAANPIEVMDVDITDLPSGIYHLLLSDSKAKRLKTASFIKK